MDETWDRVKNGGGGWTLWRIKGSVSRARLENICFLWNFVSTFVPFLNRSVRLIMICIMMIRNRVTFQEFND